MEARIQTGALPAVGWSVLLGLYFAGIVLNSSTTGFDERLYTAFVDKVIRHIPKIRRGLKVIEWQVELHGALLIDQVI